MRFALLTLAATLLPLPAMAADPHSHAMPHQVQVTHVDLDATLDFQARQLTGSATLSLDWKDAGARELTLDTRDLTIEGITAVSDAEGDAAPDTLAYQIGERHDSLGSKLTIRAPQQPRAIRIAYRTSPEASGLQWLAPEQTADKTLPFMFSQSQSIHARSWIPLQDSPAVRFTFAARIQAPEAMRVMMSAPNDAAHPLDGRFEFRQEHPIPSYLMAIAAGGLAARDIGPHTAVYAEPSVINSAAREFEDTNAMIGAAQEMYGPYRWGRYDILVLPPSFPYGGMENANLTFVTPTVLVGDKSLVSLIAHELAHSWSGNLVTGASWRDVWLNEGYTTYVENRIIEALYGKARADQEFLIAAWEARDAMARLPENSQRLTPQPRPLDAPDELSAVAYTKGPWFLKFLEQRFGREVFDTWLRSYFDAHAFTSITTQTMVDHMQEHLLDAHPGKVTTAELNAWIHQPGIPADAPVPDSPRFARIDAQRTAFLAGELPADALEAKDWNTHEWMYFFDRMPESITLAQATALDQALKLNGTANAEIGMRWYAKAIGAGYREAWPAATAHMTRIGRQYLTLPVYTAFAATAAGLAHAEAAYLEAKPSYHPITQAGIERVLNKARSAATADADAPAKAEDAGGE